MPFLASDPLNLSPHTYKFSRNVIFAVFTDNLSSTKLNPQLLWSEGLITNDP